MKKLFLLTLVLPLLAGFNIINSQEDGSKGIVIEQERDLGEFHAISVEDGIELELIHGDKYQVTVITDEQNQDKVITEVKDGALDIHPENIHKPTELKVKVEFVTISAISATDGVEIKGVTTIESEAFVVSLVDGCEMSVELYTKSLVVSLVDGCELDVNGESTVIVMSLVDGCEMKAEVSGEEMTCSIVDGSEADLKGQCKSATYSAVDGSELDASDMMVENVTVSANEGSEVEVYASNSLVVEAEDGSEVAYSGNPVEKKINCCEDCEVKSK